jgi:hypothetical protein
MHSIIVKICRTKLWISQLLRPEMKSMKNELLRFDNIPEHSYTEKTN